MTGCKHFEARAFPETMAGMADCPQCGETVPMWLVFNNLLDAVQLKFGIEVDKDSWKSAVEKAFPDGLSH